MASPVGRTPYARRRRPRWLVVTLVLLVVVPILEITVIIAVGRAIGGWQTFALLLLESALGAVLVRSEGSRAWRALSEALASGRMPSRQLADAALVLIGGTLLLTPGFLTDIVGFFLILPFTRPLARAALETIVARRLLGTVFPAGWSQGQDQAGGGAEPGGPDIIEGEVL